MTLEQLCKRLNRSKAWCYPMLRWKIIEGYKVVRETGYGKSMRWEIPEASVKRYLKERGER